VLRGLGRLSRLGAVGAASIRQISLALSSKHTPQINSVSGLPHAFCPHSGHVNFVLLAFFAFASLPAGADCQ
jgi:hypothetical protein